MIDPFVILAPILLLAIVALLRFVGCDALWGLDHLPPPPTIAEVHDTSNKGQFDDVASGSVAFRKPVSVNNLLVCAGAVWQGTGNNSITVSDTLGTLYTSKEFVPTSDVNYRVFIAFGLAPSSGSNTVTVTATAATAAFCSWGIDEFSGIDTSQPLDSDGGGVSGGPDTTASSTITTAAHALILGVVAQTSLSGMVTFTPGNGFTQIAEEEDNDGHVGFNCEFQVVTAAQTQAHTVDWTMGSSQAWTIYSVSFNPAQ